MRYRQGQLAVTPFVRPQTMIRSTPRAAAARNANWTVGITRPFSIRDMCVRCVPSACARMDCVQPRLNRSLRKLLPMKAACEFACTESDLVEMDGMRNSSRIRGSERRQRRQKPLAREYCLRWHHGQVSMSPSGESVESMGLFFFLKAHACQRLEPRPTARAKERSRWRRIPLFRSGEWAGGGVSLREFEPA